MKRTTFILLICGLCFSLPKFIAAMDSDGPGSKGDIKLKELAGVYDVTVYTWTLASGWDPYNLFMNWALWMTAGEQKFELTMDSQGWVILSQPSLGLSCFGYAKIDKTILQSNLICEGGTEKISLTTKLTDIKSFDDFQAPIKSSIYAEELPEFAERWANARFTKTNSVEKMSRDTLPNERIRQLYDKYRSN